jgi:hypothetical protein
MRAADKNKDSKSRQEIPHREVPQQSMARSTGKQRRGKACGCRLNKKTAYKNGGERALVGLLPFLHMLDGGLMIDGLLHARHIHYNKNRERLCTTEQRV